MIHNVPYELYLSLFVFLAGVVFSLRIGSHESFRTSLLLLLLAGQFAIVTGLRHPFYRFDTPTYALTFQIISQSSFASVGIQWTGFGFLFWQGDVGFNLVAWVVSRLTDSVRVYLVVVNLISSTFLAAAVAIRRELSPHSKVWVLFMTLFSYIMLLQFGNTIRQLLSLSVLYFGWNVFVRNRRLWWVMLLCIGLAGFSHSLNSVAFLGFLVVALAVQKLGLARTGRLRLVLIVAAVASLFAPMVIAQLPGGSSIVNKLQGYVVRGHDPEMYLRIGFLLAYALVLSRTQDQSDIELSFLVAMALLTAAMLSSHELAKRVLPFQIFVVPMLVQRAGIPNSESSKPNVPILAYNTAYVAYALVLVILPPVLNNYLYAPFPG